MCVRRRSSGFRAATAASCWTRTHVCRTHADTLLPPHSCASQTGDPRRLVYALDSRGLLCGANNTYRNGSVDLTGARNLYYLNVRD